MVLAANIVSKWRVCSDFCAKNLPKYLKILFMVLELCDTVFTGKAPEQNRNTGGKHHEGF